MQLLVQRGDRADAHRRIGEAGLELRRTRHPFLQRQHGGNDLQAVLHPVMGFAQQHVFHRNGLMQLFLRPPPLGEIENRAKEPLRLSSLLRLSVKHAGACLDPLLGAVRQHDPMPQPKLSARTRLQERRHLRQYRIAVFRVQRREPGVVRYLCVGRQSENLLLPWRPEHPVAFNLPFPNSDPGGLHCDRQPLAFIGDFLRAALQMSRDARRRLPRADPLGNLDRDRHHAVRFFPFV